MTPEQYCKKISPYHWTDLQILWRQINNCNTPGWEDGMAFQYLVVKMFELDNFEVRWPYQIPLPYNNKAMEEIDGVAYNEHYSILIESKDYSDKKNKKKKNISIEPIAKLRNQLLRRPYTSIGCVFSAGGYSEPVDTLISYLGNDTILLWHGEEIELCIEKKKVKEFFVKKLQYRIEYGISDFNITTL